MRMLLIAFSNIWVRRFVAFDRLKDRVNQTESVASAELELTTDEVGERLNRLDRDAEVERLLTDLKQRRLLPG